jgi:hypothetical protein
MRSSLVPSQLECDALTERSRRQSPPGKEKEMKDHAISQDGPRRPALLVFDVNETPRTCLLSLIRLTATLDGRSGTFVAAGAGGFDGTTASGVSQIVSGSGTGHLAGISGTVSSASTHADYPHMPLKVVCELPYLAGEPGSASLWPTS